MHKIEIACLFQLQQRLHLDYRKVLNENPKHIEKKLESKYQFPIQQDLAQKIRLLRGASFLLAVPAKSRIYCQYRPRLLKQCPKRSSQLVAYLQVVRSEYELIG